MRVQYFSNSLSSQKVKVAMDSPATKSEFDTFKVLSNLEFVDFTKPEPFSLEAEDRQVDGVRDVEVVVSEKVWTPPPAAPLSVIQEMAPSPYTTPLKLTPTPSPPRTMPYAVPFPPAPAPQKTFAPTPPMRESTKEEIEAEKESLLSELHELEKQGMCKLLRPLTMNDSLEEIQFQYDRIQADMNAIAVVDSVKSGIKMASGMIEMAAKRFGSHLLDGYSKNLCSDMSRFDRPLRRLYTKHWRRGSLPPEVELGSLVFGSLAYTVIQNKMSGGENAAQNPLGAAAAFFGGASPQQPPQPLYTKPAANNMKGPPRMESLGVNSWGGAAKTPPPQFEIIEEIPNKAARKDEDDEEALYKKFLQRAKEEEAEKTEKSEKTEKANQKIEKLDEDDDLRPSTYYDDEPKRIILSATRKKRGGSNLDL